MPSTNMCSQRLAAPDAGTVDSASPPDAATDSLPGLIAFQRMRSRASAVLAVGATLAFLAGGCTKKVYVDSSASTSSTTAKSSSSVSTGSVPEQKSTGPLPKNNSQLNLEQRHPNGSVLKVMGISFAATSITLDIEAVNGFTKEVSLNNRGIYLIDDAGNRYNFAAPEQNSKLNIAPGATLKGNLTFLAPVSKDAKKLKLLVNVYRSDTAVDLAARYDRTEIPEFEINEIPVER